MDKGTFFGGVGSQFMLHASSPRSVALTQLRFTSFVVINLRRGLLLQECAQHGRTRKRHPQVPSCFVPLRNQAAASALI